MKERYLHDAFLVSVWVKLVDGLIETFAGIALFWSGTLARIVDALIQSELVEDPHDVVAGYLAHLLPAALAATTLFAAVYLLIHGVVKIFVAIQLLRRKLWAYPVAIAIFVLFAFYGVYRYTFTHSIFLAAFTIFDLVVVWLVWHEYRFHRSQSGFFRQ